MLRIAVPNKGSLSGAATQILREAGYRQRDNDRELVCTDPDAGVEFLYLRPRDIATYVGSGDLDLGITGRDLLVDSGAAAEEILSLDFASSTFRFAARPGVVSRLEDLSGKRIATSYPGLVHRHLAAHDVSAHVIRLDGAVENAVRLGLADVIADVVETGATLRQAGLEVVSEPILRSEAVLIRRLGAAAANGAAAQLVHRLEGVLVARRYVMLTYDVPEDRFAQAAELTPGMESPTVSPLARKGWLAVQAMILRTDLHRVMDELYRVGARAILATDIHACRL